MKLAYTPLLLAGLAACTSTAETGLLAVDHGTAIRAFEAGETLSTESGSIAVQRFDYSKNTSSFVGQPDNISLSKGANGEVKVVYGEKAFTFGENARVLNASDSKYYGLEKNLDVANGSGEIEYIGLWSVEGDLDTVFAVDRIDFAQIWMLWMNLEGGVGDQAYFVVGTTTEASVLGDFTTSDYAGLAFAELRQSSGEPNNRIQIKMPDSSLAVNFQDGTVTGSFSGSEYRTNVYNSTTNQWERSSFMPLGGGLDIKSGRIDGSSFSGDISASEEWVDGGVLKSVTGKIDGRFYGPEGNQLAGTFGGNAEGFQTPSFAVTGWFDTDLVSE